MGAMVNYGPIFLKFGTHIKTYGTYMCQIENIAIFNGFMIVKPFSGRTFVWGLSEIMDRS